MPAGSLPPPFLIDDPAGLDELVGALVEAPIVAVDTESNSLHAYRERVCLLQFSTPTCDYILDPLRIVDLTPLRPFFSSPMQQKVFHAAEYDVICLARDYGFTFEGLFDTMVAARTLGWPQVGLAAILESRFGVTLNKKYQRADWGRRPLTPEQLEYARVDTHYLIELRERQLRELAHAGRSAEAFEEFERVARARASVSSGPDPQAFWRVSGAQRLAPQQAAILKALFDAREAEARRTDRPPFKVMGDSTLLELARRAPADLEALRGVTELSDGQRHRYADMLLRAVRAGREAPPPSPPAEPREADEVRQRYELLHEWRKKKAKARGVESDVIVPRSVLWELARRPPRTSGDLTALHELGPWRRETYGAEILRLLNVS